MSEIWVVLDKNQTIIWSGPSPIKGAILMNDAQPEDTPLDNLEEPVLDNLEDEPIKETPPDFEFESAVLFRNLAVREALVLESDPLFFKWQAGEVLQEDWLAIRSKIKARYPKPEKVIL